MATNGRRAGHGDAKELQAADGRWYAFIELEPRFDGKRRRKKISAKSRAQVLTKRDQVRADLAKGMQPSTIDAQVG